MVIEPNLKSEGKFLNSERVDKEVEKPCIYK